MSTIYRLHVEGDCDSYTCPICEHIDDSDICETCDERHAGPCAPTLCAHHDQLLAAVRAERPNADLDGLAATFARTCDNCQEA